MDSWQLHIDAELLVQMCVVLGFGQGNAIGEGNWGGKKKKLEVKFKIRVKSEGGGEGGWKI